MIDWNKAFAEAGGSLSVQNRKPPHETARNIYKEDETAILEAARSYGYVCVTPSDCSIISFVKRFAKTK